MSTSLLATAAATGALVLGGLVLAPAGAATAISHEANLEDGAFATVRVATGSALAGEWMSVLILAEGADHSAPAAEDIVYVDQRVLDGDGALTFRAELPSAELDGYYLALGTTGDTERYLAPLDGEEDPGEEPTGPGEEPTGPGEEPTGPGEEPTGPGEEPTGPGEEPTGPGEEPTDPGPSDPGATDEPSAPVATDRPTDPGATDGSTDGGPDGGGVGAGGGGHATDGDADADAGDGRDRLTETGAPVGLVTGLALAVIAVGGGAVALVRARTARALGVRAR
ncbi:hypothetical protein V2J56_06490 [Georgenia sp. MJ206]|uniref:hypothetical protein n=1 Tax=Georgenia wangjunii TaxID=3117730 RepID=UPI002F26A229